MYFNSDQPGSMFVLLAFNGEIVGLVKEAMTGESGWILQYDKAAIDARLASGGKLPKNAAELAEIPLVRREGRVDFVGDEHDTPAMKAQRMDAIRHQMGLSPANPDHGGAFALETVARQLREQTIDNVQFNFTRDIDQLPLPHEGFRMLPTGKMSLSVTYENVEQRERHKAEVASWSKEHPELVAEYVNSKKDG